MAASLAITGLASLYFVNQQQKSDATEKSGYVYPKEDPEYKKFLDNEMAGKDVSQFLEWTAQYKRSYQT